MLCSSFQHPFYPHTPINTHNPRMISTPLAAGSAGEEFREAVRVHWLPALRQFAPQMVFISAGFDAHAEDDMAQLRLHSPDYAWVTKQIMDIAAQSAEGRVVSMLEGGYALPALARSAADHIKVLMGLA
jgi:acetoin utilization deacetylase AcuC-like enzyme